MSNFDKEQVINQWRQTLKKQQGLEPGMIEELENNLRDRIDEFIIKGYSQEEAFAKATQKSLAVIRRSSGGRVLQSPYFFLQKQTAVERRSQVVFAVAQLPESSFAKFHQEKGVHRHQFFGTCYRPSDGLPCGALYQL